MPGTDVLNEVDPLDRVLDVDSHEMVPTHFWGEVFGEASGELAKMAEPLLALGASNGLNNFYCPGVMTDDAPISADTVWNIRGVQAPAAFDFDRRLAVMDQMGVFRQLIFASAGNIGILKRDEMKDVSLACIEEHNDWCVRIGEMDSRLRPVAIVLADGSVDELVRDADRLITNGIRALQMTIARPPCGISPGSPDLAPFWSLLEDANVPILGHVIEQDFLKSHRWTKRAPHLQAEQDSTLVEVSLEPYGVSVVHFAPMNFLTALILGGALERHPKLRIGMMEFGASWFGSLGENLDLWSNVFHRRTEQYLSMPPSGYLARNVRVNPFHFEPVDQYIERNPDLVDCYCYSTDYPHMEGGKDSKNTWQQKVERFGPEMMEKTLSSNGEWLLPT